jgi:hypothetical protein
VIEDKAFFKKPKRKSNNAVKSSEKCENAVRGGKLSRDFGQSPVHTISFLCRMVFKIQNTSEAIITAIR